MQAAVLTEEQRNFLLDILTTNDGGKIAELVNAAGAEHHAGTPALVGRYADEISKVLIDLSDAVAVEPYLAGAFEAIISTQLEDEEGFATYGLDVNDVIGVNEFLAGLREIATQASAAEKSGPSSAGESAEAAPVTFNPHGWTKGRQWFILNPDGSVEYECEARDEIEALNIWVEQTQPGMASYTEAIEAAVLERDFPADDDHGLPVYRFEGVIHAIHSNYEVRVVEKKPATATFTVTITTEDEPATEASLKSWLASTLDGAAQDEVFHSGGAGKQIEVAS